MNFAEAILQHYGINPANAGVGGISSSGDGLSVNINLAVPDADIPAIAALMAQPVEAPAEAAPAETPAEPAAGEQ